jgi:flagellar hook assembly protein FlgD
VSGFGKINLSVDPNPFVHVTDIRYLLPSIGYQKPTLKIYDVGGRLVKDFSAQLSSSGNLSSVRWDGTDQNGRRVANGVYFVNLETVDNQKKTKVVLLK